MMEQLLSGLRVLDFGQGIAGPYCGQMLGDHGANVIKVEPPRGDWSRTMGVQDQNGMSGSFISVNRNKRGICLDFRQGDAVDIAKTLALKADIVLESFRPNVMGRLGLGYEELRRHNPRLIYCSISGFGDSGPNESLPASDSTMQAYGGLMSIVGEPGGKPLRIGNVVSDMLTGMNAFSGILLGLIARNATGEGKRIRVSLLDSIVAFQAPPLIEYLITNELPRRIGNAHPLISPSGAINTADGMIMFTVFDHHWERFCTELDLAYLASDPRFNTSEQRQRNRDVLYEALAPAFIHRTSKECIEKLRAMDVLCSPINSYHDLVHDEQVLHNRLISRLTTPDGSDVPLIRNPVRIEGAGQAWRLPPRLGEHTVEVIRRELELSLDKIDALRDIGAIVTP